MTRRLCVVLLLWVCAAQGQPLNKCQTPGGSIIVVAGPCPSGTIWVGNEF